MKEVKILFMIFFSFLFFAIFFYYLFNYNSKLIKFRVTKEFIEKNKPNNIFEEENNKYKINKCKDMCTPSFCNEYCIQKKKYNLCKKCKSLGKCYDQYHGKCVKCKNNNSCEELFGCYNKPPINPIHNFCTRCWI